MIKFDAIGRNALAIALTFVASATMLLGAVGPAAFSADQVTVARTIA